MKIDDSISYLHAPYTLRIAYKHVKIEQLEQNTSISCETTEDFIIFSAANGLGKFLVIITSSNSVSAAVH